MRFKSKGLKNVVGANVVIIALLFLTLSAYAGSVPNVFTSGTVAKSSEVNANFTYLGDRCWDKSGSNLYYGGGNVGIGTSSPFTLLHVVGGRMVLEPKIHYSPNYNYVDGLTINAGFTDGRAGIAMHTPGSGLLYLGYSNDTLDGKDMAIIGTDDPLNSIGFFTDLGSTVGADNLNISSKNPVMVIKGTGQIGIGTQTPTYPLHMASGAYVTTGGVWTNASSREYKKDIQSLTSEDAMLAFNKLEPVSFKYKTNDEQHIGFIAEDVPDLVASKDRKGLSTMDVVALLTKVVQEQQKTIAELQEQQKTIVELKEEVRALKERTH